ncbi:MAG: sirohydrochlorin cobaltochelatase [Negativicutes bacterium]|nr:sirohydrochlorin cobaltochelatase [Negativicutes bacterium]
MGQETKKAILVVSFGTSYHAALSSCIESIENKIRSEFPGYEVRRAFTSAFIIRKLAERDGIFIDDTAQALERLKNDGFTTVIVQPTHIIPGHEYAEIKAAVNSCRTDFAAIVLGRPLLHLDGSGGEADDYHAAVLALKRQLPALTAEQAVVLMGHGTSHAANDAYCILQDRMIREGLRVYIANVEATPTIEDVMTILAQQKIRHVVLMPYMLVAGDHAINDMAGDEEDSWRRKLEQAGYTTETYLKGLGENPDYQEIYVRHIRDAIAQLQQHCCQTA